MFETFSRYVGKHSLFSARILIILVITWITLTLTTQIVSLKARAVASRSDPDPHKTYTCPRRLHSCALVALSMCTCRWRVFARILRLSSSRKCRHIKKCKNRGDRQDSVSERNVEMNLPA